MARTLFKLLIYGDGGFQTWTMMGITFIFIIGILSLLGYFRYENGKESAHSTNFNRLTTIIGVKIMYVAGISTNQGK